ncbi:hypothetical protein WBG99_21480 [Streptomyces sp. TG1A-60]|uniref:hypothetical protein n=1 Tax=Streptomyces sp. TG1A-60 TaxID=3129111 RepID=UPI0030D2FC03
MHGHGYAPQQPPGPEQGAPVTLRVIFVVVSLMSCGLLAWACLLRLASVTRRPRDWVLFALAVVHIVVTLYIIGTDPGEKGEFTTWRGDVGMGLLLGGLAAIIAYYLYADIRHFAPARPAPPAPYTQTTVYSQASGYGYPPAQAPRPYTPAPPAPPLQPPPAQQPPPQAGPEPQRPGPARIDQVRAELDELSDYLRKHEGDR